MSLSKQEFGELVAKAGAGTLTEEEAAALEPYRAKNAIILVAGTCRRCEPVSFDYPKPLIEVRGERLIERQIRQLLTAGITDITLVVGYKKEQFEYLGEKYGVNFVENPNFPTANNIVSLATVADRLGNSYILYGDQFYTVNPFETFVWRSFYATTLTDTDDAWVMETNPDGVVTDMIMSADGGEKLQGPCYVDAENGAALAVALGETLADQTTVDKSWEYAWYLHRDKLNIVTRYYPAGVVNSFKSMDELKAFDDSYLLHVKSQAMDNICGVLGCTYEDMHDFEALLSGLTNYNVAFTVGDKRYVYRHPVGYAPVTIDRATEAYVNGLARDCGVDPSFIYEDPETGWKLSYYINGAGGIDYMNAEEAVPAARLLAKFQEATKGITVDSEYDRWLYALEYERQIAELGGKMDARSLSYRDRVAKLYDYAVADNFPKVLCHNDAWYANFLWREDGTLDLIDWEFAAMGDRFADLANHTGAYYISVKGDDRDFIYTMIRTFLGRQETPEEWRHFLAHVMFRCYWVCCYTNSFFVAADAESDWDMSTWLQCCWDLFDGQLDYALSLYENA